MTILISLFIVGWAAVAILGTQTYFLGEQSKPIHSRNWNSDSFHAIAEVVTAQHVDYASRAGNYKRDIYLNRLMSRLAKR